MSAAPHRPSVYDLQRFLLGTLSAAEAASVAAWVESSPDAARALAGVTAHDALTKAVASSVGAEQPAAVVVARVVGAVTGSYVPAAESVPDVAEQTRPSGASAPRAGVPPAGPERIGPFRIVRELGRGGMGVVYEVADEHLGRRAAVKVLAPDLAASTEARQRFLREGRAAADLRSDHIVTVYQVGEADGVPFLAMEFIEGVTLETWRKTRSDPVTVGEVLWVARDLLSGLAVAHKKGRVHRDVKPANALIERETRRVKLLDFGLTRGADGGDQLTSAGRVLGTPAFMSPEQANGKAVDVRSDLFSVGVTLYALVAGRSPFARDSVTATLLALATEEPDRAVLPDPLRAFVTRLMSKDPAGRPADAGAALTELKEVEDRLAAPRPGAARSAPEQDPPRAAPRKRTALALAVAAVVLLAVVVVIIVRDKNGKEIARLKVPDDKVTGGKVEIVDPNTGKATTVSLPPGKEDPKVEPGGLRKGAPVKVTDNTFGYEDNSSPATRFNVHAGTTGTVTEFPEDRTRCRVKLDNPAKDEVWILKSCLQATR